MDNVFFISLWALLLTGTDRKNQCDAFRLSRDRFAKSVGASHRALLANSTHRTAATSSTRSWPIEWKDQLWTTGKEYGSGGFGRAYQIKMTGTRIMGAVKEQKRRNNTGKEKMPAANFWSLAESELLLNGIFQDDPHFVNLWDFHLDRENDIVYTLMEGVERGELQDYFISHQAMDHRKDPTPEFEAERALLLVDMLWGMAILHHRGIVHRDIKGANIFLTSTVRAKVADMGLSCLLGKTDDDVLPECYGMAGTPRYIAPELLQETVLDPSRGNGAKRGPNFNKMILPSNDVWALGIVFYSLIFLEEPDILFPTQDRPESWKKHGSVYRSEYPEIAKTDNFPHREAAYYQWATKKENFASWLNADPHYNSGSEFEKWLVGNMLEPDASLRLSCAEMLPKVLEWAENTVGIPADKLRTPPDTVKSPPGFKPMTHSEQENKIIAQIQAAKKSLKFVEGNRAATKGLETNGLSVELLEWDPLKSQWKVALIQGGLVTDKYMSVKEANLDFAAPVAGEQAKIKDLKGSAELNGESVELLEFYPDKQRWKVALLNNASRHLLVRVANLDMQS